jgi:two-component sensor histidine kinase
MAILPPSDSDDAALSLTMAVVGCSPAPLLLLDGELNIVAASASFCQAFDIDPSTAPGREVFALGEGEWNVRQFRSLLAATVSSAAKIDAYEMDLRRPGRDTRRLVIQAQKLVYLDLQQIRLLVAVSDVTDARADQRIKEDALARNHILLQEVRHRVANSLQIIASVLLQNARRTQSEETRGHLKDAHHRVMSVAALERQLSASVDGDSDVEIHAYFSSLCDSISASMIGESDHIALKAIGAGGVVTARVSVSMGLIVTELVINALKHAFLEGRGGTITVDYEGRGPNWLLCVSDDGVGMHTDPALIHTGLGTSIVQALAKQLQATVEIAPGHPGTKVSIEHTQIALVGEDEEPTAGAGVVERPAA